MTANLNAFSNAPEHEVVDFANLPDQGSSWTPPPPMGQYRFQLPGTPGQLLPIDLFEPYEAEVNGQKKQFVRLKFDQANPLIIVQSATGAQNNTPFTTRLSNQPRKRDKEGTMAADTDYLLAALGVTVRPASNQALVQELQKHAGAQFSASIEYSWSCNDQKDIWAADGQGGRTEVVGKKGCGKKYYVKDVKEMYKLANQPVPSDALIPYRINCQTPGCGAEIGAFANLTRFSK